MARVDKMEDVLLPCGFQGGANTGQPLSALILRHGSVRRCRQGERGECKL